MLNHEEWLVQHRAKDQTGWPVIELELDDDTFFLIKKAANALGMGLEELCNYSLELKLEELDEEKPLEKG